MLNVSTNPPASLPWPLKWDGPLLCKSNEGHLFLAFLRDNEVYVVNLANGNSRKYQAGEYFTVCFYPYAGSVTLSNKSYK
jgi:hypothetical protein